MIPMPFVWLAVILLAVVVEACTMGLVTVWFLPGALAALVLSFFEIDPVWQFVAFGGLSLLMLTVGRRIFRPFNKKTKTNTDALIGQTLVITEQVSNLDGTGAAKLDGKMWTVRAEREDEIIEIGDLAEVIDIRGVKLICRKKSQSEH